KVVSLSHFCGKLFNRIDCGIDLSSGCFLCCVKGGDDFLKLRVSNNNHINVARLRLLSLCRRAMDKGPAYVLCQRFQRLPENLSDTYGLGDNAFQFLKDRTRGIGLEKNVPALRGTFDDACLRQRQEFPLKCPCADTCQSGKLSHVEC